MKQLKKLTALFAILLAMVVIAPACSDDDDKGSSNPLVGTWVGYDDKDNSEIIYVFKADGTGYEEYEFDSEPEEFRWVATESSITLTYEDGSTYTASYSLSDNGKTLRYDGDIYTKR
ncbi:MAG: hypothetical protein J6C77_05275 [Muribaculaceae bacterium]|nr:hypothetical protein [Muribaculaceae bacterium]